MRSVVSNVCRDIQCIEPGYINVITGFVQSFGSLEDLTTHFSDLEKVSKIKLSGKP